MPIYEYQCDECGHVFEEWVKQFEVDEYPCPNCKDGVGLRLISRPCFLLKGTGWTATDEPPNKNWGKPSAAEDPYHNPGFPIKKKRKAADAAEKKTASPKSAQPASS